MPLFCSGIVRGVDMEKKLYYVLTPVPPEKLKLVNCLLLGTVAIPNCVLVGQVGVAWGEGEAGGCLAGLVLRAWECLGLGRCYLYWELSLTPGN